MSGENTRRDVLKGIGTASAICLAGCSGGSNDEDDAAEGDSEAGGDTAGDSDGGKKGDETGSNGSGQGTVEAAWVYNSEVGDLGWSWAHNEGRKAVKNEYDWLSTEYTEAVAPEESEQVFRQYADSGMDIIFGCVFGYQDAMEVVAEEYPDVYFEHNTGYATRENMGRYMGRIYEARYLAGQAAGMLTETNTLGYVAAFPIAEVVRGINAYTLGAASVNDSISTKVRWTNSWFDPPNESEAAGALLGENVDVMAQHQDSPAALTEAANEDIWATGNGAPMQEQAGENYLTSPIWHWEEFYGPTLEAVRDDEWEADAYWEGLDSGVCDIDDWGPAVPQDVKDEVETTREEIINGELDIWAGTKFEGESESFLFQEMGSYVEQVEGEVP
jgi:basic membrane protein A